MPSSAIINFSRVTINVTHINTFRFIFKIRIIFTMGFIFKTIIKAFISIQEIKKGIPIPEKFVDAVTVSPTGQITIPKKAREKLKIKAGDKLLLYEENGKLTLKKPPPP
jgi:AbrB family looped-hinge helix DNA binding protein